MNKIIFALLIILVSLFSCHTHSYVSAKSPKAFIDSRDGERYGYVEIHNREWMTENMRYNVEGSKLNPDNPSPLYGRLYNWEQAIQACPKGWRLSTDGDWLSLERLIISDTKTLITKGIDRGTNVGIFKSKLDWPTIGKDSIYMNILPAGISTHNGFDNLGQGATFWTSTSHHLGGKAADNFAYYRVIYEGSDGIYYDLHDKKVYQSCRCVRSIENNSYKQH